MAKTRRRVLSILMALVLTLGLLPTAALAYDNTTIKVVDQSGNAINGAEVTVERGSYHESKTTGESGTVSFDLNYYYYNYYTVSVSAFGYTGKTGYVNRSGTYTVQLSPSPEGSRDNPKVRFYVLDPDKGTPTDNNNENKGDYYPNDDKTNPHHDGGIPGLTASTGYTGGKLTEAGKRAIYGKGASGLFSGDGSAFSGYYTAPTKLGMFGGKTIVWYSMKEYPNDTENPTYWYCNIDGYVKDVEVNIYYHPNYTGATGYKEVTTKTGAEHQVLTYAATDLTARSGYTFTGWNTKADGTGETYTAGQKITVTGPMSLYAQWDEIKYTPSEQPTATLTLTKKWDNVALGTDTVNISVGSVSKSVTVGKKTELTFTGLTPNQQYTITETPDNYLLDKSTITLFGDLLTGMTFDEIERYESCNNLTTEDLDGANAIVAALTGHQNDGYVVWTYQELSGNEKAEFVEAFLEENINGPYSKITVENTQFISGPNASYGGGNVIVNAANGTLTFDATKVWAQFVTGTYGYLYGGEGATVTNSPKVGDLTISKTFSYEGTTNTSAPTGFGATFVVKNESGTPVASLTYAELSDSTKNPITNLPYGTYTVEETNITGTLAPAYNPTPTVSYDNDTDGTGKTDNQIALNAPTATMKVNNHYSLTNSPIVGITKTATPTATAGDTITYTITVTNTGDAAAKGKTVIDTLPSAGLQNINAGTGTYNKVQNTITWRGLTIPAGETVTLTVTADVAPLANTSQGITLVNNVAMDDLSDSVTTRVGATTATLTIEKYVTGLPAADTAAWNALVNAVSFTVTGQPESGEAFIPVTVDLDEFQSTVSGVYTYSLENLAPGTYTVTENGYDVLSTYGYTWNAENSVASVNNKTVTAGVPASAAIRNEYDSREFTIIFDSNTNGVLLNRDRSTVAMGDSFRYGWIVPTGNETVSTGPSWAGALDGETFNGSPNSQVSYTFTKAEYLEYGNHNTYSMAFSQPGVTANDGYSFTGSFTTTGAAEGMKFESLANTMAYLLASDQDQITYYANYTANGTQPNPDPIEPGPNPDPIEPGPSDPGTDIPDDNTPTTDLPEEETPTTELPDEETPMTEEPVEELPDEDVPMAEVPATGDTAGLWALAAGVSGLALVWLALSGKKRREENA